MNPTERATWDPLEAVHAGDLARPDFERWLYATPEMEAVLGPDAYLELVGRDDRGRFAVHDTRRQVEQLYAERRPGVLVTDRARRVAREFLDGSCDLWSTCRVFSALWADGHDAWVPLAFVGIRLERRRHPDAGGPGPVGAGRPRPPGRRPPSSCATWTPVRTPPNAIKELWRKGHVQARRGGAVSRRGRSYASGEPISSSAVDGCRGAPAP